MSKKSFWQRFAVCLSIALLAGCGAQAPSMAPDAAKTSTGLVIASPNQNANPTQNQQQDYRTILTDVARMYQQTNAISATIICYDSNGSKTVSSRSTSYFAKPNKMSLQVLEHTDSKTVGTKIVCLGNSKANVRTKFFGLQVKIDLDVNDSRLCNLRGDSLQDTGIVKMMNVLLDSTARVRVLGQGTLNGSPLTMLEIVSRQSLHGITREIFGVDLNRHLPVIRELYQGNKLVFRTQFQNITPNPQLPANAFTLD